MNRSWSLVALALLINSSPASTDRVLVESCSKGQPPLWIDITGCNQTQCIVYDTKFVKMTGEMAAVADANYLRMEIATFIWGFRLSYKVPLHHFDACQLFSKGCPVIKGSRVDIYGAGIANLPFTGTTRVFEVRLRNEKNVLMLCGKSTLRFEKKKNSLRNTPHRQHL